jgi:membrane protein YdbS with pleckstrin-like domain
MVRTYRRTSTNQVVTVLIIVWLVIGALAATQRGYFESSDANCAKVSTVAVTIITGPLNYVGANPKIDCDIEPSE